MYLGTSRRVHKVLFRNSMGIETSTSSPAPPNLLRPKKEEGEPSWKLSRPYLAAVLVDVHDALIETSAKLANFFLPIFNRTILSGC